jgi:uncharacterized membrane protein
MKRISDAFVKGLVTILPVALTLYLLYWLAATAEGLVGGAVKKLLPQGWYVPGIGLVVTAALVTGVGLLMKAWAFRWLFRLGERILEKLPVVKTVYGGLRDLAGFVRSLSGKRAKEADQVVIVRLAEHVRLLGFVTRSHLGDLPEPFQVPGGDGVAVYVPMSYQIGGYTTFVPRSAVTPVDMSVEDAMRFALMAGVTAEDELEQGGGESAPETRPSAGATR